MKSINGSFYADTLKLRQPGMIFNHRVCFFPDNKFRHEVCIELGGKACELKFAGSGHVWSDLNVFLKEQMDE